MIPIDVASPLYRVVAMDRDEIVVEADDISGFFVDEDKSEQQEIHLLGVRRVHPMTKPIGHAELQVSNYAGDTIGAYRLGPTRLSASDPTGRSYSVLGYTCEYRHAGDIWRRWAAREPIRLGEWSEHPMEHHASWLHVSQTAWFTGHQHVFNRSGRSSIVIDGARVLVPDGFYCALGEAVNGPGGYFGSNLDALADCLRSIHDRDPLRHLEWVSFAASRDRLNERFVTAVLGTLTDFGVRLSLS